MVVRKGLRTKIDRSRGKYKVKSKRQKEEERNFRNVQKGQEREKEINQQW